jgi:DNA-binding CsgD family transcriptional regulator
MREYDSRRPDNSIDALLGAAGTDVLAMSDLSADAVMIRHLGPAQVRPGVRYRMILPDTVRTAPGACDYLRRMALAGAEVRTMPYVPMELLVVDGRAAILTAGTTSGRVLAMRLPGVVTTTTTQVFERVWRDAVPLTAVRRPERTALTRREREILRLLSVGATDEVTAAQLGCSVRTVRRLVAQLMDRLGARSRFQAGVKAATSGWLGS